MSLEGVQDAILAAASAVVPNSATHVGAVAHSDIPAGAPYLYTVGWAISQQVDAANVRTGKTYSGNLVLVDISTYSSIVAFGEAVLAAVESDSTLLGLVDDVLVGLSTDARANVESVEQRAIILPIEATVQTVGSSVLINWQVTVGTVLRDPATVITTYLDALETALDSTLSGTRLANDIGTPIENIAKGTTRYQLKFAASALESDQPAASDHRQVAMLLSVWRHQSAGATERAYTEGTYLAETIAILDPSYWKAELETVDVPIEPELSLSDLVRI